MKYLLTLAVFYCLSAPFIWKQQLLFARFNFGGIDSVQIYLCCTPPPISELLSIHLPINRSLFEIGLRLKETRASPFYKQKQRALRHYKNHYTMMQMGMASATNTTLNLTPISTRDLLTARWICKSSEKPMSSVLWGKQQGYIWTEVMTPRIRSRKTIAICRENETKTTEESQDIVDIYFLLIKCLLPRNNID